jgi:EAL domain-containing protein (putative c-di-GMP-specific phosphodiesterase class I)
MYQVKRKGGGGHQIIDLRQAPETNDDSSLESDLSLALAQNELDVAYQPIVRTADGLVTSVEALLRWNHPDRGPVPPTAIIAIAEQSELINEIGAWVLQRACRDRGRWLGDVPCAALDLAVNVSARQLIRPDFCTTVADIMARTHMDPAALTLEVTENILIEDSQRAITVLADLRELGIRLALDDFGTGYSSLNYLNRLPIHIVKIDRSFIADIDDAKGTAIVAAVTNLAHVLGLIVIAEGVETPSQRDAVRAIGCECAQGYLYARPMAASAIGAQLGARPTSALHLPPLPHALATTN